MSNELKYFMWGYQPHFRVSVTLAADRLFTALDPALKPRVFLVGFRTDEDDRYEPICLEPEEFDELSYEVSYFADVPALAASLEAAGREEGLLHSHPMAQQHHEERIRRRSWSNAVQQVLDREDAARGWRSFVSWPADVNNFLVMCVLQLPQAVYDSYERLKQDLVDGRFAIWTSLQDAVVQEFLGRCTQALRLPEPGSGLNVIDRSNEEMLRNAGRHFLLAIPTILRSYDLLEALYDALNELAAMRYEGGLNRGRILFARKDHPDVATTVSLEREVGLMDARAARKLLEMSTRNLAALSDGAQLYGLGAVSDAYDPEREDVFAAEFQDDRSWQLSHAGTVLMRVRHGVPSLPPKAPDEGKLLDTLERVFGTERGADFTRLRELVAAASKQRHGTLVVISDHAAEEAGRLAAQATPIRPLVLTPDTMLSVTAIDGAVLLDPTGTCYALGVILDGLASAHGAPSRGARYNSAVRYVETASREFGYRTVAVVVSEDGPVNVLPDLMPRISRAALQERVEAFEALGREAEVRIRDFARAMSWFNAHRFYLSEELAGRINTARAVIESKLEKADMRMVYRDFRGNAELDDSYFLD
ncbi:MAG TPA: diadenylate cyclase [Longimicrobiaceae bacterium]|nr:diadenylate cyclase [Longimicrobiaceae bacterium]